MYFSTFTVKFIFFLNKNGKRMIIIIIYRSLHYFLIYTMQRRWTIGGGITQQKLQRFSCGKRNLCCSKRTNRRIINKSPMIGGGDIATIQSPVCPPLAHSNFCVMRCHVLIFFCYVAEHFFLFVMFAFGFVVAGCRKIYSILWLFFLWVISFCVTHSAKNKKKENMTSGKRKMHRGRSMEYKKKIEKFSCTLLNFCARIIFFGAAACFLLN